MGRNAVGISRIFVTPSTSLSPSVTFGVPVAISGLTSGTGPLQDEEFIAVDTTESSFRGRVYVAWSEFPDGNTRDGPSRVLFAASSPTTPLEFSPTREVITEPVTARRPRPRRRKRFKLSDRQMAVPIFTTQTRPMPTPARPSRALRRRSAGCATRRARPRVAAWASMSAPAGSRTSPSTTRRLVVRRAETSMPYFRRSRFPRRPRALRYSSLAPLTAAKPGTCREASAMARR
jgi:hypothetical protein